MFLNGEGDANSPHEKPVTLLFLRPQLDHLTITRTMWRPAGIGPPSCWWGTLSTVLRWTCGPSAVCSQSCCQGSRCGPGSRTWTNCT